MARGIGAAGEAEVMGAGALDMAVVGGGSLLSVAGGVAAMAEVESLNQAASHASDALHTISLTPQVVRSVTRHISPGGAQKNLQMDGEINHRVSQSSMSLITKGNLWKLGL